MLESSIVRVRQCWGHSVLQTPALVYSRDLVENNRLTAKILNRRVAAQAGHGLRHSYMP